MLFSWLCKERSCEEMASGSFGSGFSHQPSDHVTVAQQQPHIQPDFINLILTIVTLPSSFGISQKNGRLSVPNLY
jgi:hypothetical protein